MLLGKLFMRTVDKLGEIRVKARNCGELFKSSLGKIRQGTVLVVKKAAVSVVKVCEERNDEVIQVSLVEKVKRD